jgi:hypothetical protein
MYLALIANKTRVDYGNIYRMFTSMLKNECHDEDRMFFPLDFT